METPKEVLEHWKETGNLPFEIPYRDIKFFIGIDPGGSSGAIAVLGIEGDEIKANSHVEFSKLTLQEWCDWLSSFKPPLCNTTCVLEKVHAMPKQGVVSVMTFGKNVGHIEMALTAAKIPFEEVSSQKWMKFYGMKRDKGETKTEWKRRLRERLQQLMPDLKVTNNNADAYLIAYYNWKKSTQKDIGE